MSFKVFYKVHLLQLHTKMPSSLHCNWMLQAPGTDYSPKVEDKRYSRQQWTLPSDCSSSLSGWCEVADSAQLMSPVYSSTRRHTGTDHCKVPMISSGEEL